MLMESVIAAAGHLTAQGFSAASVPWPWPWAPIFLLILITLAAVVLYLVNKHIIRGEE